MKKILLFLSFLLMSIGVFGTNVTGTFNKITSIDDLTTGYYIIVGSEDATQKVSGQTVANPNYALGNAVDGNKRVTGVSITITSSTTITNPDETLVYLITKNSSNYTFLNVNTSEYLYQSGTTSGKGMGFQNYSANFTCAGYNSSSPHGFKFTLNGASNNIFKYNNQYTYFSNYSGSYSTSTTPVRLFKAYKVIYDGNGKTGGTVPVDDVYYSSNGTTIVTVKTNSGSLVKTGYNFVGWNTKADGTGYDYAAGTGTFTITANDTLYAKWEETVVPITYTMTYNANGGTGTMTDSNSPYNSGATVTVLDNEFTRSGYTFTNWNTEDDGTGSSYSAGGTFTISDNTTLYAQWEEDETPEPTPEENIVDIIVWDTAFIKVDIKNDDVVSVSLDNKKLDVVANEADSLFFSKYFEAASNVKLLGIYNGTNHDIDLSDYAYVKSNGSGVFSDFKKFSTFVRSDGEPFNFMLPKGDELILISYNNTPGDDSIIQCAINNPNINFDKYIKISSPNLDFNGDDAVALVNPEGNFIDLIGAGTKAGGRVLGADFRSCSKSGKDGGNCDGFMDSPGGWYSEDGIDLHTNDSNYHLATNRCLLVRKNTVKSGLNAVSLNTLTFETLGGIHGEWKGVQIPGASPGSADGEGTKNSCKGFDDIGKFNYGNYYGSFEQIYEIDLSTPGVLTDDSVYTLTLDPAKYNLDTLPCTDLKFTLRYRNGEEKEELYKVPIFIKTDSVIDDEYYYSLDTIVCDSCDVVILGGKSLKINATDTLKNRNVYVYPGATLIIPERGKYKVNSLTLRRDNNDVPYLSYKGSLNIKHGMFFEMRTDGSDWRWLTLPDNLRISTIGGNVRKDDGKIYTLFKHYDGAWRAEHGSGGWKLSPIDTVFNSGSGFIFGAYVPNSDTQKRLYRIPLDTNTLSQEKVSKFVTVYAYGNSNTAPNDKGWNVIGNPYCDSYVTGLDNPNAIRLSRLVKDTLSGTWNGKWIIDENAEVKDLRYIVIKSEETPEEIAAGGYKSVPIGIDNLELLPFTSFFIQAEDTAEVEFIKTSKKQRLVKANYKPTGESFLRVCIGNNKTGCFISNKFTDEYEIGDDLESLYSFYQLINGYKLLYSAVNDSIIEHGIKVYTSAGNLYLDDKTTIDDFEEINALYNGNWCDLLNGQTLNVSGEFILQAKRKVKNVATGLDETNNDCVFDKYIQNGNVYIRKNNRIFTVLGELVK